jgi:KDO2-lipid IV(A) lauroyltransferase
MNGLDDLKKPAPMSFRITTKLISHMPHSILFPVSRMGGFMHYLISAEKRRAYRANFASVPARRRDCKPWSAFQNHALNILELLKAPTERADAILGRLTVHGREHLDREMKTKKGVIVATVHCGNWELSGLGLALMGYPITTIAGEQLNDGWSESIKNWKRDHGIRVLSPQRSLRDLYRDLHSGRIIVLHMDGDLYSNGIPLTFLGKPARMPRGPAHLSRMTGAAICFAFSMRRKRHHLEITVREPIAPPRTEQAEIDVTKKLTADIEECILAEPGQWCIFRTI